MTRLTEGLVNALLISVLFLILLGSVILYKEKIIADRVAEANRITALEASVKEYNTALRSCQQTNQVLSATKK